jgi:hypothetical protein
MPGAFPLGARGDSVVQSPKGFTTMPMHDWSKVNAGLFHHFHQGWRREISSALNGGLRGEFHFAS